MVKSGCREGVRVQGGVGQIREVQEGGLGKGAMEVREQAKGGDCLEIGEGSVDQGLEGWTIRKVARPIVDTINAFELWVKQMEVFIIM